MIDHALAKGWANRHDSIVATEADKNLAAAYLDLLGKAKAVLNEHGHTGPAVRLREILEQTK